MIFYSYRMEKSEKVKKDKKILISEYYSIAIE